MYPVDMLKVRSYHGDRTWLGIKSYVDPPASPQAPGRWPVYWNGAGFSENKED